MYVDALYCGKAANDYFEYCLDIGYDIWGLSEYGCPKSSILMEPPCMCRESKYRSITTELSEAIKLYNPQLYGATVPYEVMPKIMQRTMDFLPLTQGIKLLKGISLGTPAENVVFPIFLMIALAAVCFAVAVRFFRWE